MRSGPRTPGARENLIIRSDHVLPEPRESANDLDLANLGHVPCGWRLTELACGSPQPDHLPNRRLLGSCYVAGLTAGIHAKIPLPPTHRQCSLRKQTEPKPPLNCGTISPSPRPKETADAHHPET